MSALPGGLPYPASGKQVFSLVTVLSPLHVVLFIDRAQSAPFYLHAVSRVLSLEGGHREGGNEFRLAVGCCPLSTPKRSREQAPSSGGTRGRTPSPRACEFANLITTALATRCRTVKRRNVHLPGWTQRPLARHGGASLLGPLPETGCGVGSLTQAHPRHQAGPRALASWSLRNGPKSQGCPGGSGTRPKPRSPPAARILPHLPSLDHRPWRASSTCPESLLRAPGAPRASAPCRRPEELSPCRQPAHLRLLSFPFSPFLSPSRSIFLSSSSSLLPSFFSRSLFLLGQGDVASVVLSRKTQRDRGGETEAQASGLAEVAGHKDGRRSHAESNRAGSAPGWALWSSRGVGAHGGVRCWDRWT